MGKNFQMYGSDLHKFLWPCLAVHKRCNICNKTILGHQRRQLVTRQKNRRFENNVCPRPREMMWLESKQTTKRLTKIKVKRRLEKSSLARFLHSYVRNALPEMVKTMICKTWGCCYRLKITPSSNLSYIKRILIRFLSGSWAQKCWDRCGWSFQRLRGGQHFGWRRDTPLWIIPWYLPNNWGKTEKTSVSVAE
jgi:hypothetical protein